MTYSGPINEGPPPRERIVYRGVQAAKAGVSLGSALAMVISWTEHHSILWAVVHGILSWLYVVYYALTR